MEASEGLRKSERKKRRDKTKTNIKSTGFEGFCFDVL
jgi:hypothetical protein